MYVVIAGNDAAAEAVGAHSVYLSGRIPKLSIGEYWSGLVSKIPSNLPEFDVLLVQDVSALVDVYICVAAGNADNCPV